MDKLGFVYIWYDKKHHRYYIGKHWGTIDDGYVCSSSWMKRAYKIRPQDFKRRIIQRNISRENLLEEEFKWLSMIKDEELGKRYYNLRKTQFGHWADDEYRRLSVGQRISKAMKGKKKSEEQKRNMSACRKGKKPWNAGLKTGPNPKLSESKKGKIAWNKGVPMSEEQRQSMIGRTLSEEHKQRIKETWNKSGTRQAWNKGKKGLQVAWNKGLRKK